MSDDRRQMDIQEMVDRRIAEITSRAEPENRTRGNESEREREPAATRVSQLDRLTEFGEIMDAALTQVAAEVLDVTERLAGDYTRLEKNILKSKLEALSAVESVLDTALFLRREARERLSQIEKGLRREVEAPASWRESSREPAATEGSQRASMHEGVAALFRRTL